MDSGSTRRKRMEWAVLTANGLGRRKKVRKTSQPGAIDDNDPGQTCVSPKEAEREEVRATLVFNGL